MLKCHVVCLVANLNNTDWLPLSYTKTPDGFFISLLSNTIIKYTIMIYHNILLLRNSGSSPLLLT